MPYTVNGVSYTYRRPLYANTVGISACTDLPLPFVGPNLTGKALANLNDVVLTEADGATLLGNVGDGSFRGWWEAKTITAPVGHGQFDLAGGSAAELVAYLYYGGAGTADLTNKAATYPANYLAMWAMNEASGNLVDATGKGLTGVVTGSPLYQQSGRVDGAIEWSGTSQYATAPGPAFAAQGTIAFWAYCHAAFGDPTAYFIFDATSGARYLLHKKALSDGSWGLWLNNTQVLDGPGTLVDLCPQNAWTHVAITWDMTHPTVKEVIYRNGSPFATANVSCGNARPTNFYICARFSASYFYDGLLDHFSVQAVQLTASQVLAVYRAGLGTLWTWGEEETAVAGGRLFTQRNRQSVIAPGVIRC